jgi:hypothetical protein
MPVITHRLVQDVERVLVEHGHDYPRRGELADALHRLLRCVVPEAQRHVLATGEDRSTVLADVVRQHVAAGGHLWVFAHDEPAYRRWSGVEGVRWVQTFIGLDRMAERGAELVAFSAGQYVLCEPAKQVLLVIDELPANLADQPTAVANLVKIISDDRVVPVRLAVAAPDLTVVPEQLRLSWT